MVNPFHIQSIEPEFNSLSLLSQIIGCFTSSQPYILHTSSASSRSKPVYSPFSSIYPYGGYSASKPTVKVSAVFFFPHPASAIANTPIASAPTKSLLFNFISIPLLCIFLYFKVLCLLIELFGKVNKYLTHLSQLSD